jgi:hypothetical protein
VKEFATGCLPLTRAQLKAQAKTIESATSLPEYLWQKQGEMPVIRWDDEFEKWLDRRIQLADRYRKKNLCLLPWEIYKALPVSARKTNVYAWNQGSLPSCSMHAAVHAYQTSLLTAIALGSPLEYEAFNPLYPFYLARGGNVSGGLDIYTTAEWANEHGFYSVSLVGTDNLHIDRQNIHEYEQDALRYQSGIVYIEGDYETKIVRACRALCSVCFGSGRYFQSCRTDSNGVKVMASVGYGGHAQCFTGWREVNGEEYIFNQNSWGDQYNQTAEGEPGSGSWLGAEERSVYWRDIDNYGHPYLVFVEGDLRREGALYNDFELPSYPKEWID